MMKTILIFLLVALSAVGQTTFNNLAVKTNLTVSGADAVTKVASVSALKAIVAKQDGMRIDTLGYYSPGDGGGSSYYFSASSSSTPDNGSVVQPNSGSGRFLIIKPQKIGAKQFGAVGDGASDDTSELQEWINYCRDSNTEGYWNTGTYLISSPLVVTNGRVVLRGSSSRMNTGSDANTTRVSLADSSNCDMFVVADDARVDLRQVYFLGNKANNSSGKGVVLGHTSSTKFAACVVEDVTIVQCAGNGIEVNTSDVYLTRVYSVGCGGYGFYVGAQTDVAAISCFANRSGSHGWVLNESAAIRLINCDSAYNSGDGFKTIEVHDSSFVRIQSDRNMGNGLNIFADTLSYDIVVTSSLFVGNNWPEVDGVPNPDPSGTYANVVVSGSAGAHYGHKFIGCQFYLYGLENTATKKPSYQFNDNRTSFASFKGRGISFSGSLFNTNSSYFVTDWIDSTIPANAEMVGVSLGSGGVTNSFPLISSVSANITTANITTGQISTINSATINATNLTVDTSSGSLVVLRPGTSTNNITGGGNNAFVIREKNTAGVLYMADSDYATYARLTIGDLSARATPRTAYLGADQSSGVNANAVDMVIRAGVGTGNSPTGGSISFQFPVAGASGSTQQSLSTGITFGRGGTASFNGNVSALGVIELGNSSDTTLARSAAGTVTIEGKTIITSTTIMSGTGSPEGAVTAPVGTLFLRSDGGAGSTLYVKESGTGNTGWIGK